MKAALFDLDGTLVDTTELIFQSMNHAVTEVLGEERSREELMANVGQPLPAQMKYFDAGRADELLEAYRTYNDEVHETFIASFPNVEESLARLRDAGIKIAVVTSKRRHSVGLALDSFPALRDVVDHFVTMEDTTEHKPRPEPLLKALELLGGVSREEAAYVGDSPFDIEAAKAARLTSVGVSWGAFTGEALRAANPDHLVSDLDAAVDVLLNL
ncbi:MAG: HAD-IA family hydrolase [Actinomycetota bacterium]|jgi:pyrophosphatase PpaX|nr:HAD-IA family hydrolase [Rubrobacter sp.]MDQ3509548.1 HAD-IA family hydrolase [Actinomycetota bacterium]